MTPTYTHQGSVEGYVEEVLRRIPRPLGERERIAMELRSHLADELEAGVSVEDAVARMGSAEEVAKGYLAEVDFAEASIMQRVAAFLLDLLLGVVFLALAGLVLWSLLASRPEGGVSVVGGLLWVSVLALGVTVPVLSVIYFPVFEALFGRTAGKRVMGIYVTREGGEAAGWGPAIVRRIPFFFDIFWLDAVFALFTRRRQRAFDLVARTVVVRE